MFLMNDPRWLDELEVDRTVWSLQNAAAGEPVRVPSRLSCHDDLTWSRGQLNCWPLLLQDEEKVALTILWLRHVNNPFG
jgi:hypothetical protein